MLNSSSSPDKIGVGIDFGTSNSSVAIFDGKQLFMVPLDAENAQPEIMPTAIYVDKSYRFTIGQKAISTYLKDNAGKLIELKKEMLNEIEISVAGTDKTSNKDGSITYTAQVHQFTNQNIMGRLFRGLKTWLGYQDFENIRIFDQRYEVSELLSQIFTHFKSKIQSHNKTSIQSIYVGRPVSFQGGRQCANKTALARLSEACKLTGFQKIKYYLEPVAASLSYMRNCRSNSNQTFLTFDFGGGTLDLCIVKKDADNFEVLGTEGMDIGGDMIDKEIYREKVFPELGEGCSIQIERGNNPKSIPFPFFEIENSLLNWQLTHELNKPDLRGQIARGIDQGGSTGEKLARLKQLITRNLSYLVLQAIEKAKIELSTKEKTKISVPQLPLEIQFTRLELNSMLSDILDSIEIGVHKLLKKSNIAPAEIDGVVCTGGSSKIPVVQDRLKKIFPGKVTEHDAFISIAFGLALADYYDLELELEEDSLLSNAKLL